MPESLTASSAVAHAGSAAPAALVCPARPLTVSSGRLSSTVCRTLVNFGQKQLLLHYCLMV